MNSFKETFANATHSTTFYDYNVILNSYIFICMMKKFIEDNCLFAATSPSNLTTKESSLQEKKSDKFYTNKSETNSLSEDKNKEIIDLLTEEADSEGELIDGDLFFDCKTGDNNNLVFEQQTNSFVPMASPTDDLIMLDSLSDFSSHGASSIFDESPETSSSSSDITPEAPSIDELIKSHNKTKTEMQNLIDKALKLCNIKNIVGKKQEVDYVIVNKNEESPQPMAYDDGHNIVVHAELDDNPIVDDFFECDPSTVAVSNNTCSGENHAGRSIVVIVYSKTNY